MLRTDSDSDASGGPLDGVATGIVVGERYEIVRMIGEGGMGAVFEARHVAMGRSTSPSLKL